MIDHPPDELAIFRIAHSIQSAELREAYLRQMCRDDASVRDRVVQLLEASQEDPAFLEIPPTGVGPTVEFVSITERPGTQIGPYQLVEELGDGGMGIVYRAAQREPIQREVALKIIKPGMDTQEVLARFQAEEQALARMDHPHVAKVLDAGRTDSGRPYFVMELVHGVTITQYCDDHQAPTRQRLELFVQVCQAVQHAHQKGIIHRDLKPSNILVTLQDGVPVPKIIDFGIAKALHQPLTATTAQTVSGQLVCTPLYASPEQLEANGWGVDTRSDIYSLGVLLYELLTGSTPFARERFQGAGLDEIRRVICEEEPPRPSTRISTLGQAATTATDRRHTTPAELTHALRGELDWIVMQALEKDRARRYQTASDFARDLERYLHDEPVEAGPPSRRYRLKKFVRRHRMGVLATVAVSLAILLGAGIAAGQAYRATQAEQVAEEQLHIAQQQQRVAEQQTQLAQQQTHLAQQQKQLAEEAAEREGKLRAEAEQQRDLAQKATQEAEAARKQAEAVTNFLVDIFRSPDPERDGRTITVAEMLDKAKTRVQADFQDDKLLQAKLLGAIADTYSGLGLVPDALDVAQQASDTIQEVRDPRHPETLVRMNRLAEAMGAAGHLEQSLALTEEVLRRRQEVLGPEHPDTLESMNNLATCLQDTGQSDKALALCEETLKLHRKVRGPTHEETLLTANNLATALMNAGRPSEAQRLLEGTLASAKETLGPDHLLTLTVMGNLANAYSNDGQVERAVPLMEEEYALSKEKLGVEHPSTVTDMSNLACFYWSLGKLDQSIPLFEETVRLRKKTFGDDHPDTLQAMGNLGINYLSAGRSDDAVSVLEDALVRCRKSLRRGDNTTLFCQLNLGKTYLAQRRWDDALPLLEEALSGFRETLGAEHPETLAHIGSVGYAYWKQKRLDRSVPLFEETFALCQKVFGSDHQFTLATMADLGKNYTDDGQVDRAVRLLEDALGRCRATLQPGHRLRLVSHYNLAGAYVANGQVDQAISLLEEELGLNREAHRADAAVVDDHAVVLWFYAMRLLGDLRFQRGDFTVAEPLLREAYEGLAKRQSQAREPEEAKTMFAAATNLLALYEKTHQPDKAVALVRELLVPLRQALPPDSTDLADRLAQFSLPLLQLGAHADAEPLLRECLAIRENAAPDDWRTFNTKSMLGGSLLGEAKQSQVTDAASATAKRAEAEPLLVQGYEGMQQGEATIPPEGKIRLTEALQRLVDLCTALAKPDEAAKWQEKLDALTSDAKPGNTEHEPD